MKSPQLKKLITPALVTSLGLAGFAQAQTPRASQDLTGAYGAFSEAALQSAAFDAFGEGFRDETPLGQALDYFKFGVNVKAEYNDNIFLTNAGEIDDVIIRVSVPLELSNSPDAENQWSLKYVPNFNFYADNSDQDGVDHFVNAGYKRIFQKTSVDFGVGYAKTQGADRFASGSIEKTGLTTNLGLSHQLTGKSKLDLDLTALSEDFVSNSLSDRERYNARLNWQYQVTGKISVGPYIAYEHSTTDGSFNPTQDAISFGARGNYQALQKTTLIGYLGAEYRKFDGDGLEDKTSPTFEFGAQHQLTGKTILTGMLYHNIRASYSDAGQSYTATGFNFLANYAATARINARAGMSYEHDNYFGTSSAATGSLDSDYVTFFVGGDYVMDCGVTLGSGLRYSNNDSETATRDFGNLIFNLSAGYSF